MSKKIQKQIVESPKYLYHGTAKRFIRSIKNNRLLPQDRQYVHLSEDKDTAFQVGRRRDKTAVILIVKFRLAWKMTLPYYR
ncbi:RNA 2'-phosphotransferase [Dethiothermospora halolimnae]|uniref:RNA 2'-phosphotransferase n=1 Tax=Dethiothermospora halolimnae TaxID=3114390 RepID=UPI003CCC38D0